MMWVVVEVLYSVEVYRSVWVRLPRVPVETHHYASLLQLQVRLLRVLSAPFPQQVLRWRVQTGQVLSLLVLAWLPVLESLQVLERLLELVLHFSGQGRVPDSEWTDWD